MAKMTGKIGQEKGRIKRRRKSGGDDDRNVFISVVWKVVVCSLWFCGRQVGLL